jgi:transposase
MHNPRVDDRSAMDAILFVLRTGCQWDALNRFRGVLIRWAKRVDTYLAMLHFACALITWKKVTSMLN